MYYKLASFAYINYSHLRDQMNIFTISDSKQMIRWLLVALISVISMELIEGKITISHEKSVGERPLF